MGVNEEINKILVELESFCSKGAYGGPVVHYWRNSMPYSGYGVDWRYEGLVKSFILLYEKGGERYFVEKLREIGDFIILNQRAGGGFSNCGFEANPSFNRGAMPHEASVIIALLEISRVFKKNGISWKIYYDAAKKQIDNYLIPNFWDEKEKAFVQYEKFRGQTENIFVPNKMATISEALGLMYNLGGNKNYWKFGLSNMRKAVSLTDENGGSTQSEKNTKKITFYNAREVPALLAYGFDEVAKQKVRFIENMWDNGFAFGEIESRKMNYPKFVAGSGAILKAISLVRKPGKKYVDYLIKNVRANGSIQSFEGLANKNTFEKKLRPCLDDQFSVVGWMDKTLEFLALSVDDFKLEPEPYFGIDIDVNGRRYSESADKIIAGGKTYSKKGAGLNQRVLSAMTKKSNIAGRAFYKLFY